ncbi:hypothetical protein ACEN2T_20035, partial [Pseudomonas sp. W22_MBD1_FP4]|uniref:hypothetical protein n=1 Tax=Pseudomonas sp. W22_MBD1_FP4 TaxID=3240272 RepID=UPI003F94326C
CFIEKLGDWCPEILPNQEVFFRISLATVWTNTMAPIRQDGAIIIGAPGMARCAKRNQLGCGGHAGDLEVKVLYTPGKGKC